MIRLLRVGGMPPTFSTASTHLGSGVCSAAVETTLIFAEGLEAIPGYRDQTPTNTLNRNEWLPRAFPAQN
jgi:hypothetical protein